MKRLYIGTEPNPEDRLQIVVSDADHMLIPARGARGSAEVTDTLTGKRLVVRRVSCGLPGCLCALGLVRWCEHDASEAALAAIAKAEEGRDA